MKRIVIIIIVLINILVLSACVRKPNHNCEIIKIDGSYENFKLEENTQYAFYSTYDHKSLVRYNKVSKEKLVINITFDDFTISEDNIYFSQVNILKKCDLEGNVLLERTLNKGLQGLVYDLGYLYFLYEESNKEDSLWETSINYFDEDYFMTGDISSKHVFTDETIQINESYFIWSRYLYSYKNNITYGEKDTIKYLYHGEDNYNYDKISYPELKADYRRSYPIKHKLYGDSLYLTFYTYTGRPHLQNYTCYSQYREYILLKYNFIDNKTEVVYSSKTGELILNFNESNVYLYRNGDIIAINLTTGEESVLGKINKIENIEDAAGSFEQIFLTSDYIILHFNSSTATVGDVIFYN